MSAMRGRVFIHIGAPKTGTTYLQRLFYENRSGLREAGILYPEVSLRGYGHHDLAFLLGGGYPEWATPGPRTINELREEMKQQMQLDVRDVLLSSEDFFLFPAPRALHDFLDGTEALAARDAVIIVYVRRQDLAHESWYNQTIKAQGYDHDIEDSLAAFHDLWDYEKQLAPWETHFGRDSLIVRVYEEQQFVGNTLLQDFVSILGLPADKLRIPGQTVNPSLNYDLLQVQRHINRLPIAVQQKRRFHHQLMALSQESRGSGVFDERPAIGPARAAELLADYNDSNTAVAQRYLGRDRLFLDETVAQRGTPPHTDGLTAEKMLHILGWLAARDEDAAK